MSEFDAHSDHLLDGEELLLLMPHFSEDECGFIDSDNELLGPCLPLDSLLDEKCLNKLIFQ